MLSVHDLTFQVSSGPELYTLCWLGKPRKCDCQRMAMMLVNRDGRSRCMWCDEEYRRNDAQLQSSHTV